MSDHFDWLLTALFSANMLIGYLIGRLDGRRRWKPWGPRHDVHRDPWAPTVTMSDEGGPAREAAYRQMMLEDGADDDR